MSTVGRVVSSSAPVSWRNVVGASASGGALTKTAVDGWGNAGASSVQQLAGGPAALSFRATAAPNDMMVGLSQVDTDRGFASILFAIYLSTTTARAYESGVAVGALQSGIAPGDLLTVAIEGGAIKYKKNGTTFYTSLVAPAFPLIVDCALKLQGATLDGVLQQGDGLDDAGSGGSVARDTNVGGFVVRV